MSPEERQRRMQERLAAMSPEERERFQARMRENGPGRADQGFGRRDVNRGIAGSVAPGTAVASGATTIDALFAPLPPVESRGRVWLYVDNKLKPINVRLGISDGTFTELISGELAEGQEVIVNMLTGLEQQQRPAGQQGGSNPLMQQPGRGGRGPGGGGRGR
jgi:HlyD family secretion protein